MCLAKRIPIPYEMDAVSELEGEYRAMLAMRALYGSIRGEVAEINYEINHWLDTASDLEEARINLATGREMLRLLKQRLNGVFHTID